MKHVVSGSSNTNKKAVYEPTNAERCRQLVCSRTRAVLVVVMLVLFAIVIALISAFARPGGTGSCPGPTTVSPQVSPPTTEPVSTDGKAFPWKSIRLPDSVKPLTYTLSLHPDLDTSRFEGEVSIKIKAEKATDFIVFHSKNLTISSYEFFTTNHQDNDLKKISINKKLETKQHEQIYIEFDKELEIGQLYKLRLTFSGVLSDGLTGFYKSSYQTSNGKR